MNECTTDKLCGAFPTQPFPTLPYPQQAPAKTGTGPNPEEGLDMSRTLVQQYNTAYFCAKLPKQTANPDRIAWTYLTMLWVGEHTNYG